VDLLFKRAQTPGRFRSVKFKLWGKIELTEDERRMVDRYDLDHSILIYSYQENLIRNSIIVGLLASVVVFFSFASVFGRTAGGFFSVIVFGGAAWFHFDWWRETIFVKDLMYGRHFTCRNIIDLGRREAWLKQICSYLRQVMESAKNWDGEERTPIEPLAPEDAKNIMIRGIRWFDM